MKDANSFYRTATIALCGVLLTGAASWMTFGKDKISRTEAKELIRDAPEIISTNANVKQLVITVGELKVAVLQLEKTVVRLNTLLENE